ncbi:MAG: hypothetical protein GX220_02470 [Treponema sp.]|nr:hypothetical protein [Treponema sp.]
MKKIFCFILIIISSTSLFGVSIKVVKGIAYFEDPSVLEQNVYSLNGDWELYLNRHIQTAYTLNSFSFERMEPDAFIYVPNYWKERLPEIDGKKTSFGIGTYRLLVANLKPNFPYALMTRESPGTSSKWFVNGKQLHETGIVNEDYRLAKPQAIPCYVEFSSDDNGVAEIVIQVANGTHRKGGLWDSVLIAEEKTLFHFYSTQAGILFLIFGILIFLALFNIILYFLNRKNLSPLWLGLFCSVLALRVIIANFSILTLICPNIPYGLQLKLEYISLWMGPSLFILILNAEFKKNMIAPKVGYFVISLNVIIGIISLILPIRIANKCVPILQLCTIICLLYVVFVVTYLVFKKHKAAYPHLINMIITGTGLAFDLLFVFKKGILPFAMLPFSMLFFSIFQFLLLSKNENNMYIEAVKLNKNLSKLNKSYLRYVPKEFLQILKKDSVIDVNPGDFVETEMTITYTNLHIIQSGEQKMPLDNHYTIISEFLKSIASLTKAHNGFISKFVSSGFIALFPYCADDALNFASAIKDGVDKFNKTKKDSNYMLFATTGVHYGKMILGTIGEPNRLDDTVISDTVNTVSRIENTAIQINQSVVLSQCASDRITQKTSSKYTVQPLGNINVKGKKQPLALTAWISLLLCLFINLPLKAQTFSVQNYNETINSGINIDGPWEFYWGKFIDPCCKPETEADCIVYTPSFWNNYELKSTDKKIAKKGQGSATYRIKVENLKPNKEYGIFLYDLVLTAFNMYVNGQLVAKVGEANENWEKTVPKKSMESPTFFSDKDGILEIVFHVSNKDYRIGGIWKDVTLKEKPLLQKDFFRSFYQSFLFIGALFIIFFYQLSLFFFRKSNKSSLYLSLFSFSILLRILSSGFSLLAFYFPNIPFSLLVLLEHEALFFGPLLFVLFVTSLYPDLFTDKYKNIPKFFILIGIILSVFGIFFPVRIRSYMVRPWQIYLVLTSITIVIKLLQRSFTHRSHISLLMSVSVFVTLLCSIHDIMYLSAIKVAIKTELLPYGFIVFVLIQSAIMARQHIQQQEEINNITDELTETINACYRFVPQEVLQFFEISDITSLKLGEKTTRSMTLMNTDIRNFTEISESISAKDTFDLLNRYLTRVAPIIRSHFGFIEKYLGDGIIALFPKDGEQAALCAIEMHKEMIKLRKELIEENKPILKIGIGLHYGTVVLGTVGNDERMNEISVSPDIDTVITIETLTKIFDKPIIVSESAKNTWKNENMRYTYTELDSQIISDKYKIKEKLYAIEELYE